MFFVHFSFSQHNDIIKDYLYKCTLYEINDVGNTKMNTACTKEKPRNPKVL